MQNMGTSTKIILATVGITLGVEMLLVAVVIASVYFGFITAKNAPEPIAHCHEKIVVLLNGKGGGQECFWFWEKGFEKGSGQVYQ